MPAPSRRWTSSTRTTRFSTRKYPRPVSGCAAEVSQRIAEAVFVALAKAIPDQLFAAPAGTSGNLGVGGTDPKTGQSYVMYVISGGGYGGSPLGDGISNGCSTIGISKTTPIEIMEQRYPVLFEEFSLHEGSGGAGEHRGGFGVNYKIRIRRGEAVASMVMDHGRTGPIGVAGGQDGGLNTVRIVQGRRRLRAAASFQGPEHRPGRGRPDLRVDPGRRRLWRVCRSHARRHRARHHARLLHKGGSATPVWRCALTTTPVWRCALMFQKAHFAPITSRRARPC